MEIKNLSLSFFTVILVLFLIEIALRINGSSPRIIHDFALNEPVTNVPDKNLGWSPKVGQHTFKPWSEDGKITKFTINKDKSRLTGGIDSTKEKIIFIGGSLTQGWAVDDLETFSSFLSALTTTSSVTMASGVKLIFKRFFCERLILISLVLNPKY